LIYSLRKLGKWIAILGLSFPLIWPDSAYSQGKKAPRKKAGGPQEQTATPGASIQPKFVISRFPDWVESVAFSPDGKTLAAGSYGMVKMVDVASQQEIAAYSKKGGLIKAIAYSADGKLLVTGGYQSLDLWDTGTGQIVRSLKGHRGFLTSVCFTPDQKILASASDDETVRLWNVATGSQC
jgi:WD40 repeat protein